MTHLTTREEEDEEDDAAIYFTFLRLGITASHAPAWGGVSGNTAHPILKRTKSLRTVGRSHHAWKQTSQRTRLHIL
eukprot:220932-Amphidinium_carterae.1